jgi:hypothetical protein
LNTRAKAYEAISFESFFRESKIGNPKSKLVGIGAMAIAFAKREAFANAQQATKAARIGFLDPSTASGGALFIDAFRQELSKLGWVEGKNVSIEYRFAEGKTDRLPELLADLFRLKVDLIVVAGSPPHWQRRSGTRTRASEQISYF